MWPGDQGRRRGACASRPRPPRSCSRLRDEEAARAAVLHRLSVERDALEREEARAKARQAELETRLAQASRDLAREEEHIAEAEGMLRGLARKAAGSPWRVRATTRSRSCARRLRERRQSSRGRAGLAAATTALAEARAERRRLEGEKAEHRAAWRGLEAQAVELAAGACQARRRKRQRDSACRFERRPRRAFRGGARRRGRAGKRPRPTKTRRARRKPRRARSPRRPSSPGPGARNRACHADQAARAGARGWSPIVEAGQGRSRLRAGARRRARRRSRRRERRGRAGALAADRAATTTRRLPDGASPLSQFVQGAGRASRRLGADRRGRGGPGQRALQAELKPGQRLVSKEGDLWRWDGYSVKAGTASAAGARLVERSRLAALTEGCSQGQGAGRETEAELAGGARQGRSGGGSRPRRCGRGQGGARRARPHARRDRRRRA